jgi:hypothetical protein
MRVPISGGVFSWPITHPLTGARLKEQLDGVKETMKDNISKVLDRGDKLADIEDRSGALARVWLCGDAFQALVQRSHAPESLQQQAGMFSRKARRVSRVMWWQNMKVQVGDVVGTRPTPGELAQQSSLAHSSR